MNQRWRLRRDTYRPVGEVIKPVRMKFPKPIPTVLSGSLSLTTCKLPLRPGFGSVCTKAKNLPVLPYSRIRQMTARSLAHSVALQSKELSSLV